MQKTSDDNIGYYIGQIYRKGLTTISNELQEFGIGSGQYAFLLQLYQKDGINQEKLSTLLSVDKTTVARAVKKLEEKQLIYRIRDEQDKRCYKVFVTEKAWNIKEHVLRKVNIWDETIKKNLTNEEEAQMLYLLRKITDNLIRGENI